LQGIADAMALSQAVGDSLRGWRACIEAGVNVEQIRDVTVRFLTAHPELRHYTAAGLVAQALAQGFLCPQ